MNTSSTILKISEELKNLSEKKPESVIESIIDASNDIGRAWSGSWLGYQSRVYYKGLEPIPPGMQFSQEWGVERSYGFDGTQGEWEEWDFDELISVIKEKSGHPDLKEIEKDAIKIGESFEELQSQLMSTLSAIENEYKDDNFFNDLIEKIKKVKIIPYSDFLKYHQPRSKLFTRDSKAGVAGMQAPPHFAVLAEIYAIQSPYTCCENLSKHARRIGSHLGNIKKKSEEIERIGTNIFIGHGRSSCWRELKDFVSDRLHLPWDEFNHVPVAGITNIARLSQMLDNAAFAFAIMTAEDEQADGKMHARMNVIHEAGLFQGRLGFEKAILLVEEGCEEFSNVQGLGQIRFPAGNISAAFEEIRQVLEREKLIEM